MQIIDIIFYIVFISQLLLISHYFPRKLIGRANFVFNTYPPSEYPKLYPKSMDQEEKGLARFGRLNQGILWLGFVMLITLVAFDYSGPGRMNESFPIFFGLLQFLPYFLMELSGFNQFKLMRMADARTKRKASLEARRLLEFVTPGMLALGAIFYSVYILVEVFTSQPGQFLDGESLSKIAAITASNILFVGIALYNMYGKKLNPHQTNGDRTQQIKTVLNSLIIMSILESNYFIFTAVSDAFDLKHLELALNSFYFLIIATISIKVTERILHPGNTDFTVYKVDTGAD
ncbi:MAG: hypothetical protein ACI9GW_002785 [Halieaceae bacterium]|jgi:hypothetical protein